MDDDKLEEIGDVDAESHDEDPFKLIGDDISGLTDFSDDLLEEHAKLLNLNLNHTTSTVYSPEEELCLNPSGFHFNSSNFNGNMSDGNFLSNLNSTISSSRGSSSSTLQQSEFSTGTNWTVLSNHNLIQGSGIFCNRSWDNILCWPSIPEGTSITLQCFSKFNGVSYDSSGTVTRICEDGGFWKIPTDYSNCTPIHTPNSGDDLTLEITTGIYFGGYCLSLFALLFALFIFLAFKELRCVRNSIHSHLILTYILADAFWIITSIQSHTGQHSSNQIGSCITFIFLHYFHLTNFFWMFVEGLYLYVLVVQTFIAENIKLRVYAFIGWGIPLIICTGWSIAKWVRQSSTTAVEAEFQNLIPGCIWLNVNQLDWIYKAPAILALAANLLFLARIMFVLITKLRSATSPETQQSRKAAKALLVLMPLLGVTYVLVLVGSKDPIYEHIRALLISTQGFLVACLYCFMNGEVRLALRHRWNRFRSSPRFNCCDGQELRQMQDREWSPRSRTESLRLYTQSGGHNFRKRESSGSEITTMSSILGPIGNNGNNHGHSTIVTLPNSKQSKYLISVQQPLITNKIGSNLPTSYENTFI